jgi:hypothetical protein
VTAGRAVIADWSHVGTRAVAQSLAAAVVVRIEAIGSAATRKDNETEFEDHPQG